jgi:3-deoxy-D-arabino-heptulosonate 7-phosphate (DAHP) synthase
VSLVAIILPLGYLKSKVYEKKPRTTVGLKQNIRDEVAAVSPTMLQRVMQNFQKSLRECVNKGRHLTDTIFRKRIL